MFRDTTFLHVNNLCRSHLQCLMCVENDFYTGCENMLQPTMVPLGIIMYIDLGDQSATNSLRFVAQYVLTTFLSIIKDNNILSVNFLSFILSHYL